MSPTALSKITLFAFLLLNSQLYCVKSQDTTATQDDAEGTTGEVLQVGTTGESLSVTSGGDDSITPPPVTGSPDSSTSITTHWSPSSGFSGSVKRQAGYMVNEEYSSDNNSFQSSYSGPAVAYNHTLTGLQPSTTYYFRVSITNGVVVSDYSPVTAITTSAGNATSGGSSANATTGVVSPTNSTGASNAVNEGQSEGVAQKSGGLSGGVIAGIVIAAIAVAAAAAAVVAKTAFATAAPVAGHWLDSAVQNPLYQAGEQAFENPMYEAPAEATA